MQNDNVKIEIILLGILFFGIFAWAQSSRAEIISADRRVTWQGNVGVSGDIPSRSTICSTAACVTAARPTSGDNKTRIQNAIDSCPSGQVVLLGAGTYTINSQVTLKSNVVLRGAGPGVTTIATTGTSAYGYMAGVVMVNGEGGSWDMSSPAGVNLSSGYTKGSTTINTSSAHGWNAGDVILIDQLNSDASDPPVTLTDSEGCNANCGRTSGGVAVRSLGQVNRIKTVLSTTQVELEIPLYQTYSSDLTPQGVTVLGLLSDVGIENLTIDTSSISSTDSTALSLNGAESSWVSNVEVVSGTTWMANVLLYHTYRNTIRGCNFHGSPGTVYPGASYGFLLLAINSANLIENNLFRDLGTPIIMDGVASGNVFAYNYT